MAVSVIPEPAQTTVGFVTAVIVGSAFTVIAMVCVCEHPALSPITVYVAFTVGVSTIAELLDAEGNHVYVLAPVAVNVVDPPKHMAVGLAATFTVGLGSTLTVTAAIFGQLFASKPITL